MIFMLSIILFLALSTFVSPQNMFTLQLHPTDRGARCLDGSPAGLYYHQGTAPNNRKFIIYMDSGGFCHGFTLQETLEACYKRSKTGLGTTTKYPPQKNLDDLGLLSTDPKRNPVFHDWTKIFVIYCDGSEYTGSREDPISYKDTKLYFRGYNNVLQQFRFLDEKFDFYNGETIVLTGVSAGGMGTYFYSNYLYQHTKTSKFYAIPDSGIFLIDYFSTIAGVQVIKLAARNLMTLVNEENSGFPISECIQDNRDDILECYTTSNLTKYLKAPMMIVQSPYDSYSIENIIYSNCLTNKNSPYSLQNCNETTRQFIEDYRMKVIGAVKELRANRKDVGLWAPSCAQHGYTDTDTFTDPNFRVPSGSGVMVYEAIREFLRDPKNAPWYMDEVGWPYNAGCSGLTASKLRKE